MSLLSFPTRATTGTSSDYLGNSAMSKTVIDSQGGVNFLWVERPSSTQNQTSGIWYSRYALNGTSLIPPVLIHNSTLVQSADMVVDGQNVPHIVWAEGAAFANSSTLPSIGNASLYSMVVNFTNPQSSKVVEVDGRDGVVMWPTLAIDNSTKIHIVWSATSPNGEIHVYYGLLDEYEIERDPIVLATYNQSVVVSQIQMTYDGSSALHVVWVKNENSSGSLMSTVNYAYINPFQKNITRLQIAHIDGELNDAAVMNAPNEGAYVLWQPQLTSSDDVLYVSHLSRNGSVVFSREISAPVNSKAWHFAITSDSQENLYLVWYPAPILSTFSNTRSVSSNVNYVKILGDGSIAESGNDVVSGQVLAVNVGGSDNLYAISTQGMVQVPVQATSSTGIGFGLAGVVLALTVAIGGVAVTDEGKYRVARSLSKLPGKPASETSNDLKTRNAILTAIARTPGLKYSDLRTLSKRHGGSMLDIVDLEEDGYLASVRVGLTRGFYIVTQTQNSQPTGSEQTTDPIANRIVRAVALNPGTWEGQLARDLALSQQIVHYHLKRLVNRKVITATPQGRRKLYHACCGRKVRDDSVTH